MNAAAFLIGLAVGVWAGFVGTAAYLRWRLRPFREAFERAQRMGRL